tara:strand:+ start:238 stop:672 length:435 start_codon:yes stop_codon:yes gene_type:complete
MLLELINDFNLDYKFDKKIIYNLILKIAKIEDKICKSINLIFSTDHYLNNLKVQYFNQNYYTDVIAFNLENKDELIDGEIYISMDRVIYNANKFGCSLDNELKRIIIHGVLHLMGYEDIKKNEKSVMTNLENQYISLDSRPIII